jgi:monoamine oxidase
VEAVKPLDAIIIGAGFSGLRAGLKLKEAGQSFLILEARDRVGGRVKAGEIAGQVIDLGGMWTCDNQQRLMELIKQHGLKTFPTFLEGHALVELMGKTSKCPREDFAPALPLFAKLDYARLEGRLNRLIDSVDPASPQSSDPALDAMSFGEWIRRNVKAQGLALMLTLITRSVFCAEPDQISLLNWLTYLKAGGGLDRMIAAEPGGAQHLLIEGGFQHLGASLEPESSSLPLPHPWPIKSISIRPCPMPAMPFINACRWARSSKSGSPMIAPSGAT